MTNWYCDELGIEVPRLEQVKDHREANVYVLLIVALLEHGSPMTLAQVARRFEEAGIAPVDRALASLQRCRPDRAPVYRDGDRYSLDPYDKEVDLWVFRLGLRPPRVPRLSLVRPEPEPLPGPEEPLTVAELQEAWKDQSLSNWSDQRVVLAVLDAHGGAMFPHEVVAFVSAQTPSHRLRPQAPHFKRRSSAVAVQEEGRWAFAPGHEATLRSVREAVRQRLEAARRWASQRPAPATVEANIRAAERRRAAHAAELARLRRVIVHTFPVEKPEAVVLLDVGERAITTFIGGEIAAARERLDAFDLIAAVEVRPLLRALGYQPGRRRLAELGPPQNTMTLSRGRTVQLSTEMLIHGSCGIRRPFGDPEKLREYLRKGRHAQLRRRLEADVKALFAFYQYGRLHGSVRLRWGLRDELIPVPWVHPDETRLYGLKRQALERGAVLEVVTGSAPGWSHPWSRARRCHVQKEPGAYEYWMVDEAGWVIEDHEVQLARLVTRGR